MIEPIVSDHSHRRERRASPLPMIALFSVFLLLGLFIIGLGLRHFLQYAPFAANKIVAAQLGKQNRLLMLGALIAIVGVIGIIRFAVAARQRAREFRKAQ